MENGNNAQSNQESTIQEAIQNIVAGNSFVGNGDGKHGKLYNDAIFGLSCTAYGIDVLLRFRDKNIPSETIQKCTQKALQHVQTNHKQKTNISNSSKNKLPEVLVSLLEKPTIQTIVEIFSIVFGNSVSELKVFDAMLDFKVFDFNTEPNVVDTLIEYINSRKNDYSNEELEWFIDAIRFRKGYCKKNIDVMNKFIDAAKAALSEHSLHTA